MAFGEYYFGPRQPEKSYNSRKHEKPIPPGESFSFEFMHPRDPKNPCIFAGTLHDSTKILVHVRAPNQEKAIAKANNNAPTCKYCRKKYVPFVRRPY
jgi:hypothetical protein